MPTDTRIIDGRVLSFIPTKDVRQGHTICDQFRKMQRVYAVVGAKQPGYLIAICDSGTYIALGHKSGTTGIIA